VIVLADADLDAALQGVMKAIFTNAGQVCSAGSRLIIERRIAEPFLDRLVKATAALTPGRGVDDPALGPLISPEQLNRVASYVDGAARAKGCSLLTGGERLHPKGLENGWFFAPTIITVDDIASPIVQEEVFGPVLAVQIAENAEDALRLANGTAYGLVAGIYTSDITRALRLARDVDAGQVFINQYFAGGVETPFGGTKNSGFGREKGLDAVRNYLRVKTVTVRL
jgi:aldehyde dehydrogenase (NAD+)